MIRRITYSANAISSLTDIQIQNIINRFRKKPINMDDTINCQEVIGVPKKNAHMSDPSSSNDISTENSCDEDANNDEDSDNDDSFNNNEDDGSFCGFSDDDFNTGKTYTKSERSICVY